jgi:DNA-binding beta-propeller fold protein YncE
VSRSLPVLAVAALLLLACSATPEVPSAPMGPAWAIAGEQTEYVVTGVANRGAISIQSDWGDGDTSIWSEWLPSRVAVAVSHAWDAAGTYQALVRVRSSSGRVSDWSVPTSVRVLPRPGYPNRVIGSATLHGEIRQMVVSPDDGRLLVRNNRGDLTVVRTADLSVETFRAGFSQYSFAIDHSGEHAYVARGQTIGKYAIPDLVLVDSILLGDSVSVWEPVASPAGEDLYVLSWRHYAPTPHVLFVDGTTMELLRSVPVPYAAWGLFCAPSGGALYVLDDASIHRIDAATGTQTGVVGIGPEPDIVAMSADGLRLYVTNYFNCDVTAVDAVTLTPLVHLPGITYDGGFAASSNNRFVYCRHRPASNWTDSIAVYDAQSWLKVADYGVGQVDSAWSSFVVPSADGLRLYVSYEDDSVIQVLGF